MNGAMEFSLSGLYDNVDYNLKIDGQEWSIDSLYKNTIEGEYLVTAANTIGCADSLLISVPCIRNTSSNSNEETEEYNLCFPNPFNDFIEISIPVLEDNIQLYRINGEELKTSTIKNNNRLRVITSHLESGIYIIKCGTKYQKIIKVSI